MMYLECNATKRVNVASRADGHRGARAVQRCIGPADCPSYAGCDIGAPLNVGYERRKPKVAQTGVSLIINKNIRLQKLISILGA
jgi:hypothetical protein